MTEDNAADREDRDCPIVGIGASAGGLESLERFFDSLPASTGWAFVVIQHLSPNYETMMDRLLSRHTQMPVKIIADTEKILPNHVFLIPPKKTMTVINGQLQLDDQDRDEIPHLPIDHFFTSMAQNCGRNCAAIVLSGTGSDGSRGIQDVHEADGLVLVESEAAAKFTGMPRSAQNTGCVDKSLPPEAMIHSLKRFFGMNREFAGSELKDGSSEIEQVFGLLKDRCRVDFSSYKSATVTRRIERRMVVTQSKTLAEFLDKLRQDPNEIDLLYADMLIGVTKFFRDLPCFVRLEEEAIREIIRNADSNDTVRIWVSACATGEEAYSIAMIFDECCTELNRPIDFKIFATDVHQGSLARAGLGIYSEELLANVSDERKEKYFDEVDGAFQITKEIRQRVIFAPHNVLEDPPFTDVDLITCRNLLIYFDLDAQKKALSLFLFGLKRRGVLMLGPSESPGTLSDEFDVIDERCRIFRKRRDVKLPEDVRLPISVRPQSMLDKNSFLSRRQGVDVARIELYDQLLDLFAPPSILVNEHRIVMETFGGAEQFLKIQPRRMSMDVLDLLNTDLKGTVASGLRRAQREGGSIQLPSISIEDANGDQVEYVISVRTMTSKRGALKTYLLTFEKTPGPVPFQTSDEPRSSKRSQKQMRHLKAEEIEANHLETSEKIRSLEDELFYTRENLQATIEELESTNEEMQATNEELISSNEELQSTNEELNSVNEELHTVNSEFQSTISELRELNEDMNHLLSSTDIGTIFLDENLRIRRYTPKIARVFKLEPQDIGRPLSAFSHTLSIDDLEERLGRVLATGEAFETEVDDSSGTSFLLRLSPYEVESDLKGVVLTLVNIDNLVKARTLVEKYRNRLQATIDSVPIFIASVNSDQRYEFTNQAYVKAFGKSGADIVGQQIRDVIGKEAYEVSKPHIQAALQGEHQHFDGMIVTLEGERRTCDVHYIPQVGDDGTVIGFFVSASDVTLLKSTQTAYAKAVEKANQANDAKSSFLANMSHEIRTPITSILGFAELLLDQHPSDEMQHCIKSIQRNGNHLVDLINDILQLAKIEAGRVDLTNEVFLPSELLSDVCESLRPRARSSGLHLTLNADEVSNDAVSLDRRRMRQIILNIAGNAIKFTSQGGSVHIEGKSSANALEVTVSDTGCGIPDDKLKNLFEPFYQVDSSNSRAHEGTGLGLAITQQLVERMGATLEIQSSLGVGTSVSLTFPVEPIAAGETSPSVTATPAKSFDSNGRSLRGRRILVIDDRRDIRFITDRFLTHEGAEVVTVESGSMGLVKVSESKSSSQQFDCIVTDIQMPDMDGYETTRILRSDGYNRPILALTASAMDEDRDRCIEAGCSDFLAKPIDRQRFVEVVTEMVSRVDAENSLSTES